MSSFLFTLFILFLSSLIYSSPCFILYFILLNAHCTYRCASISHSKLFLLLLCCTLLLYRIVIKIVSQNFCLTGPQQSLVERPQHSLVAHLEPLRPISHSSLLDELLGGFLGCCNFLCYCILYFCNLFDRLCSQVDPTTIPLPCMTTFVPSFQLCMSLHALTNFSNSPMGFMSG
jgi:hypothetical protein